MGSPIKGHGIYLTFNIYHKVPLPHETGNDFIETMPVELIFNFVKII